MMKILTKVVLLTLAPGLFLAGCGDRDPSVVLDQPAPSSTSAAQSVEVIASWSEGDPDASKEWLAATVEPLLITTEVQRDAFLANVPEEIRAVAAPVRDIDLTTYTLLVAGFSQCGTAGVASVDDGLVRYEVRRVKKVECVWAPLRVDVFRLPGTSLTLQR